MMYLWIYVNYENTGLKTFESVSDWSKTNGQVCSMSISANLVIGHTLFNVRCSIEERNKAFKFNY